MADAAPSRLAQLETWVRDKPDDAFVRYALALELKSLGREEDAAREFATLIAKKPDYVPSYLMFGNLLGRLGRTDEAREVLEKGLVAAQKAGNHHAAGEIQDALAGLA